MGKELKVRKIGNSVGVILPSSLGLKSGDIIQAKQEGNLFILDTTQIAKEHDRKLIEESGMATLFLTKIIRCCECCGVMATIALDNEHPRI